MSLTESISLEKVTLRFVSDYEHPKGGLKPS